MFLIFFFFINVVKLKFDQYESIATLLLGWEE